MFTHRQMQRFVKKIYGSDDLTIIFYDRRNQKKESWSSFAAVALCDKNIIYINRNYWNINSNDKQYQKYILLHEVGHFKDNEEPINGRQSIREFNAQMWALKRTKQLGMKKLYRRVIKELIEWSNFDWISCDRKYVMAYKIAKLKGII